MTQNSIDEVAKDLSIIRMQLSRQPIREMDGEVF